VHTRPARIERLVELIDDPDLRVALMASKEVLNRAYGKPVPATDADDRDNEVTVVLKQFDYQPAAAALPAPPRAHEP
jgi:hypothetical protein